mmetsp:Transcript_20929/g.33703  ORF Transcript_20929/g.33703 Transcript_20929/m.33703 type:complete len:387 (+) Transcript_20929:128-1288(+)
MVINRRMGLPTPVTPPSVSDTIASFPGAPQAPRPIMINNNSICFPNDFSLGKGAPTATAAVATLSDKLSCAPPMVPLNVITPNDVSYHLHPTVISDDDGASDPPVAAGTTATTRSSISSRCSSRCSGFSTSPTTATATRPPWFYSNHLSQMQREDLSRKANAKITMFETKARETRQNQRWAKNPAQQDTTVRLVGGCVPILRDGRILLISSRKENCWLSLPKGGWELDESLEEAAIRETYEEAGVLGILGPSLDSFLAESGKKKKRKLSSGNVREEHTNRMDESTSSASSSGMDATAKPSSKESSEVEFCDLNTLVPFAEDSSAPIPSHTHTCMTFFPLYVQQILEVWPENLRERKAYPIDEAIRLVRPELRWMLEHIQKKGIAHD